MFDHDLTIITGSGIVLANRTMRNYGKLIGIVPALAGFPDGHITTRIWLRVTLKLTLKLTLGCLKMHHDPGTLGQF